MKTHEDQDRPPAARAAAGATVVVLGASANPERHSNMAVHSLKKAGFAVLPVNPALATIGGLPVVRALGEIRAEVHTVTLYVSEKRLLDMVEDVVRLAPKRVVFNPGAESPAARRRLEEAGIECVEGCTLVMIRSGMF